MTIGSKFHLFTKFLYATENIGSWFNNTVKFSFVGELKALLTLPGKEYFRLI